MGSVPITLPFHFAHLPLLTPFPSVRSSFFRVLASHQPAAAVTKTLTLSWLARVVAAKLDDGNVRAAMRILCSEDSQAQPSLDAGLAKLHAMQLCDALTSHHQTAVSHCTSMNLSYARQLSFPAGSACGPDSLCPQHLKQLISCRKSSQDILTDLTTFANTVLAERCPKSVVAV